LESLSVTFLAVETVALIKQPEGEYILMQARKYCMTIQLPVNGPTGQTEAVGTGDKHGSRWCTICFTSSKYYGGIDNSLN
jgi:hypothetical protein